MLVNEQTASYTVQPQDNDKLVVFNSPSAVTATLPNPAVNDWIRSGGGEFSFSLANIGAGPVTISPVSATIDGESSITLDEFQGVEVWTDGTNYFTVRGTGGGTGTVSSVGLTVPSRQTVTGSPVTSTGTLAIADNAQSANQIFAGPASGAASAPAFRALVPADLPLATTSAPGAVQPDGTSITISGGKISAVGGGGGALTPLFGNGSPFGVGVVQAQTAGADSLAFSSNVSSGNLLIVAYKSEGNITASTCSDTLGTPYTKVASITGQSNNLVVFAGTASASGANTVTIGSPGNSYDRLGIMEVSGVSATVDATQTDYAGSTPTTVTITTATANDFILGAVAGYHSVDVFSFGSPWTLDSQSNGSDANAIGHQLAGVAGAYPLTVTVTGAGADNQPIILVAFKSTASSVAGSEGQLYFDTSLGTQFVGYVYHSSAWNRVQ